jgi:hypothetical protein
MCAAGSHEITFAPSGNWISDSVSFVAAIRFRCTSCTPFGGPVVPDV